MLSTLPEILSQICDLTLINLKMMKVKFRLMSVIGSLREGEILKIVFGEGTRTRQKKLNTVSTQLEDKATSQGDYTKIM